MKRIELYTTATEAESAFHQFCDYYYDDGCDGCPYWNKTCSCELLWAMEEVDDTNIKTGKWIDKEHWAEQNGGSVFGLDCCYCSICGTRMIGADYYNYCPECGSKMEEIK